MKKETAPDKWEIRYWTDSSLSSAPERESFQTPEEARERREEIMASGHAVHLRLFSVNNQEKTVNDPSLKGGACH
jgi:hypothetical protein